MTLNKLEGDAALLYGMLGDDQAAAVRGVASQVEGFFAAFHAKARELSGTRSTCPCEARVEVDDDLGSVKVRVFYPTRVGERADEPQLQLEIP